MVKPSSIHGKLLRKNSGNHLGIEQNSICSMIFLLQLFKFFVKEGMAH